MWLLDARTRSRKFVSDSKDYSHAYAILSHTREDEECTFQELLAGTGTHKKGWVKVVKACEQALKDGWQYVWIDTVCINKESSAELSEAINSMWHWYCDAQVCYAFLSDVETNCPELEGTEIDPRTTSAGFLPYTDSPPAPVKVYLAEEPLPLPPPGPSAAPSALSRHSAMLVNRGTVSDEGWTDGDETGLRSLPPWHNAFSRSRWFTRGWTLQELIAPETVVFYGRGWNMIAHKKKISYLLWKITGIDPLALENRASLSNFVIARKMSWARSRRTTRVEDRAYSLLGIMGVNMPLLYGEGERAFTRLQEEIIKISTDHSIFAWDDFPSREYMTGEALDVLFATSPDQFTSGHRMVRWVGDMVDLPFRVTNRGVAFDGLLIKGNAPDYRAALNCRYEDDLRGVIALRLRQQDDITDRYKKREILSRVPKFWVRFGYLNPEGFCIADAWPPEFWNRQTGVMVPQARRSATGSHMIRGSVEIEDKRFGHKLSVAFESPARLRAAYAIRDVHEFAEDEDFRITISTSQQRARALLEFQAPTFEAEFENPTQGLTYLSVRVVEVTEILNDVVCILKVSFTPSGDSHMRRSANTDSKSRKPRSSQPDSIPIINVNGRLS